MNNYSQEFLSQEVHYAAGYTECANCKGNGVVWIQDGFDEVCKEMCENCNGLGLIK